MSKLLEIVTVANRVPEPGYYTYWEFFASCRKFGHEPLVLGQKAGEYRGLGSKPKLLKRAIERGHIQSDWLLFCDCFDIVFERDPALAIERMQQLYPNADMVIGGETNCFPLANLHDNHQDYGTPFRFVNSGFMLARTGDFLKFLVEMDPEQYPDDGEVGKDMVLATNGNDQSWVMQQHIFGKAIRTQIDYKAELVCNLCGLEPKDIVDLPGGLMVKTTRSYPVAWHWNGPAKTAGTREPILKALGYNP